MYFRGSDSILMSNNYKLVAFQNALKNTDRGLEESVCVRMRVHVCVHAVA